MTIKGGDACQLANVTFFGEEIALWGAVEKHRSETQGQHFRYHRLERCRIDHLNICFALPAKGS